MNTDSSIKILENCEFSLRDVGGEALKEGNYELARQILAWAESVAAMAKAARPLSATTPVPEVPVSTKQPLRQETTAKSGKQDEYPHFMRRGDELVKIGWSKQDKKEYNHRAPKAAVDAVVSTLKTIAADGSGFTSDDLSRVKDSERGGVFPLYQIFVVLGWLRVLGVLKQHGRKGGYTLIVERPIDSTVASAWDELPSWRG